MHGLARRSQCFGAVPVDADIAFGCHGHGPGRGDGVDIAGSDIGADRAVGIAAEQRIERGAARITRGAILAQAAFAQRDRHAIDQVHTLTNHVAQPLPGLLHQAGHATR